MCDVGVYPLLGANDLYILPLNLAVTSFELPRAFTLLAVGDQVFQILTFGSGSLVEVPQFKTYYCTQSFFFFYLFLMYLNWKCYLRV